MAFPAKLVAAASLMRFWFKDTQPVIWICVYGLLPIAFNLFNVRRYGEIEFWLTSTKVAMCVGLIILGFALGMGASPNPPLLGTSPQGAIIPCVNETTDNCLSQPGFDCKDHAHVWTEGVDWREQPWKEYLASGAAGRLAALWLCCCQACYSYMGCEIIGITAVESEKPRNTIPNAVRRVSKRIIFYYVGAVFALGLNVSSNDPVLASYVTNPEGSYQGPFVLMIQRANIRHLDSIINAATIVAVLGVANTNLYVAVSILCRQAVHE
jgi:yeast amino acid transporter